MAALLNNAKPRDTAPPPSRLVLYDTSLAPPPFGLNNTGVICYLNAFLQMFVGFTALTSTILENPDYACRTATGAAMLEFFRAFATLDENGVSVRIRDQPEVDISMHSTRVQLALIADLKSRRPHVTFGQRQESASEALTHVLDMMEPPMGNTPNIITNLFKHRHRCELYCRDCSSVVSKSVDYGVVVHMTGYDDLVPRPSTPDDFASAVVQHLSKTEDYKCPKCPCRTCGNVDPSDGGDCPKCKSPRSTTNATRRYRLAMLPEILICAFNLYEGFGGVRRRRYFPEYMEIQAKPKGVLAYQLVAQVEHSGQLSGGHYWARGLRAGGRVHKLNDTGVVVETFDTTPYTYMVAYHACRP